MKSNLIRAFAVALMIPASAIALAQLSQNPDKFLGNITTRGQVNYNGVEFSSLWNQLTPENETKWASVEGSRNSMNWGGADACYNYCKEHDIPLKFHTLVWGSQYPSWITSLSQSQQYDEVVEWMDKAKERYPDLPMIDVVNEAIPGHAPAPFKDALGGDGTTGYDWIVKAFELAYERWPDAILIYNDYNTFQWNTDQFISLVKTLRDAGAPIDAYGCQSHDLTDCSFSVFKSSMDKIQNTLNMPMYSSEYDIATTDDQKQLNKYREQVPYMWEKSYFAGLTLWGYVYGCTWTTDGNSGIVRNGEDRPAMTWLREYMASDEALNAEGPFKGGVKEASIYIKPQQYKLSIGDDALITVRASLRTKAIEKVELYKSGELVATFTEAPFEYSYTPSSTGHVTLKAIVYDTDGGVYERIGGFDVCNQRTLFHGEPLAIPGTIQAEDFDGGDEGVSYHDTDSRNQGTSAYRSDCGGVDIVSGGSGYVWGYIAAGEWLEYTVDVAKTASYIYEVAYSSVADDPSFSIYLADDNELVPIVSNIKLENSGSWNTYITKKGRCSKKLEAGEHRLRIVAHTANFNLDYVNFSSSSGIADTQVAVDDTFDVYTTTGVKIGTVSLDDYDSLNDAVRSIASSSGIFVVRGIATGHSEKIAIRK